MVIRIFILLVFLIASMFAEKTTISEKTKNMKKYSGYFTFYWDEGTGKIWLEINRWDNEFLYLNSLPVGIGSNDIGLDRGQMGNRRIVKFKRIGPKVLLIQPNYSYRAITDNHAEQKAVEDAFAQSVLWGAEIAAEEKDRVLVDASSFFLHDAHNVIERLKDTDQGIYKFDETRSAFYLPGTKNFPKNSEIEVMLTFAGDSPGKFVKQVVPDPKIITVRQHHSFIQLPDKNYKPRKFDPRAGYFGISYLDYSTPISESIQKRFIARHRLEKKNPSAKMSEPINPIVYYIDPGAPEPIRSALMEGARWWNQAFKAAGYINAFQVKLLPEDADPMDVRYNVIQWVHRSTRGWSYGDAIMDPRTGEIIKGHISLGSLRVRQDYLIAEGLLAPYESGKPVTNEMQEMALARLRQLSAHEVGHTLGLAHNFAASVNNRASVMDYPYPYVKIKEDGTFDLSEAYGVGIGEWDKITIQYGYSDFSEQVSQEDELKKIIIDAAQKGHFFITDQDARPLGGAHPLAHLWDNGNNVNQELERIMKVREVALSRFSEKNILVGTPMAKLEEVLIPLYFSHRYQIEATAKLLGGMYYTYALRGDGQIVTEKVPPKKQRHALELLLKTIEPKEIAVSENILDIIPPRAFGMNRNREVLNIRTGVTFDPLSAAEATAHLSVRLILHRERAARLIEFHSRDSSFPSLEEVIDKLVNATWRKKEQTGYTGELQRVVNSVVLYNMVKLAADQNSAPQVKAITTFKMAELSKWLSEQENTVKSENWRAHYFYASSQIERFMKNPEELIIDKPLDPPDGSPIGFDSSVWMQCGSNLNNQGVSIDN